MRNTLTAFTIASALTLSACGSETSESLNAADGDSGEYTIDTETGEASFSVETEDGTSTMRAGADVPVDLPMGFSVYPNSTVISNMVFSQGEGQGSFVTMESDDSPEEIAAFYRKQAETADIPLASDLTVNNGRVLSGQSADGQTFSVNVSPSDGGSIAQLAVGNINDN